MTSTRRPTAEDPHTAAASGRTAPDPDHLTAAPAAAQAGNQQAFRTP